MPAIKDYQSGIRLISTRFYYLPTKACLYCVGVQSTLLRKKETSQPIEIQAALHPIYILNEQSSLLPPPLPDSLCVLFSPLSIEQKDKSSSLIPPFMKQLS